MKYTKKFTNVNEADGYVIPNPFIGYVENGQLIANSEDGKKLKVEGQQISIVDNLISFTIMGDSFNAEPGMDWTMWLQSEYGSTQELVILDDGQLVHLGNGEPIRNEDGAGNIQYEDDIIINGADYNLKDPF